VKCPAGSGMAGGVLCRCSSSVVGQVGKVWKVAGGRHVVCVVVVVRSAGRTGKGGRTAGAWYAVVVSRKAVRKRCR